MSAPGPPTEAATPSILWTQRYRCHAVLPVRSIANKRRDLYTVDACRAIFPLAGQMHSRDIPHRPLAKWSGIINRYFLIAELIEFAGEEFLDSVSTSHKQTKKTRSARGYEGAIFCVECGDARSVMFIVRGVKFFGYIYRYLVRFIIA